MITLGAAPHRIVSGVKRPSLINLAGFERLFFRCSAEGRRLWVRKHKAAVDPLFPAMSRVTRESSHSAEDGCSLTLEAYAGAPMTLPIRRPRPLPSCLLTVLLLSPLLFLSGCTMIRIEAADDAVRIERHWGVLSLEIVEPKAIQVAEVTALGIIQSPFGWSAGYSHQTWASLGPECRLVIWVSSPEHIEMARELANSPAGACVAGPSSVQVEVLPNAYAY